MWNSLFFLLTVILAATFVRAQFTVTKFQYTGYQNVWHTPTTLDVPMQAGTLNSATRIAVRNTCANFCSLSLTCDAFYLLSTTNGTCWLVDEALTPNVNRTIGYGLRTGRMYYVKSAETSLISAISTPSAIVPPCDTDNATLSASACSAFPPQALTYFTCSSATSTYAETVTLMSDVKCGSEQRLLECEMAGQTVTSNIQTNTTAIFTNAFLKTMYQPLGMLSSAEPFNYVTVTFANGPVRISRVVVRSTRNGYEHIQNGQLIVTSGLNQQSVSFTFASVQTCAVHVNFAYTNATLSYSADSLELMPTSWYGTLTPGFKMDVFVLPAQAVPSG